MTYYKNFIINKINTNAGEVPQIDKNLCIECGACSINCPEGAITVKTGVGCAAAVINGILTKSEPNCDCLKNKNCC